MYCFSFSKEQARVSPDTLLGDKYRQTWENWVCRELPAIHVGMSS